MERFWVSWWTRKYVTSRGTARVAPFQYWLTGETFEDNPQYSLCAVIDEKDEKHVEKAVKKIFGDAAFRFCDEKPEGWTPASDRFPME